MKIIKIAFICLFWLNFINAQDKPNIVFIYADDQSWPHAGAYGDKTVKTPFFDRVAEEGVLFNNAFVSVPSCAPSRAVVLTGRNVWELNSASNLWGVFPDSLITYTKILLDNGYQLGNAGKGYSPGRSDVTWANSPVGNGGGQFPAFFSGRDESKPFAYWFGSFNPHRPYDAGSGIAAGIDADAIELPPYLPDSPEVRSDVADYYKEIQDFDVEIQTIYETLEAGGELDNTLIVISSDNGMPFPRAKTNLYDGGCRVPMAVMWPDRIPAGRILDDFVNTTDLAPTFIEAAGLAIPDVMTGKSLLPILTSTEEGLVNPEHTFTWLGRERHTSARDENYGYPIRALRTQNYLYLWNIFPDRWPAGNPTGYQDIDGGPTKSWLLNNREPTDKNYFELSAGIRPEHELYDLQRDPDQVKNAAYNPAYESIRDQLREQLEDYLTQTGDLHMSGQGHLYEEFEQTRNIRDISYVEPTEPFIDELTGDPLTNIMGGTGLPGLGIAIKKTGQKIMLINPADDDVKIKLLTTQGRLLNSAAIPATEQREIELSKSVGIIILQVKRTGKKAKSRLIHLL